VAGLAREHPQHVRLLEVGVQGLDALGEVRVGIEHRPLGGEVAPGVVALALGVDHHEVVGEPLLEPAGAV
jgi:hypothetical protein